MATNSGLTINDPLIIDLAQRTGKTPEQVLSVVSAAAGGSANTGTTTGAATANTGAAQSFTPGVNSYQDMANIIQDNEYAQSHPEFIPQLLAKYGWTPQSYQAAQSQTIPSLESLLPAGWTTYNPTQQNEAGNDVTDPTHVVVGPDGTRYDVGTGTKSANSLSFGPYSLTPVADVNKANADTGFDAFMTNLPKLLAVTGVTAGLGGGFGALQGLEGTSILSGGLGAAGGSAGSSLPANYWNMLAEGGATASDAASAAAGSVGDLGGSVFQTGAGLTQAGTPILTGEAAAAGGGALTSGLGLTSEQLAALGLTGAGDAALGSVAGGGAIAGATGAVAGPLTIPGQVVDLANSGGNLIPGTGSTASGLPNIPPGTSTALQRVFDAIQKGETPSAGDIASLAGTAGSTLLGYLGAQNQTDAYKDVANQYLALGAPYRNTLAASYQPGFDLGNDPTYQNAFNRAADVSARSWSSKAGNPAGSPTAQGGILSDVWNGSVLPALSNYRGQLGQFGGLGLNTSGSASMAGAGSSGGTYDALGYGLANLTQPQNSIQDLLKQLGGNYKLNLSGNP